MLFELVLGLFPSSLLELELDDGRLIVDVLLDLLGLETDL
jgi:hypothetical protein